MKKVLALSASLAMATGLTLATSSLSAYGMAGCGLGSMIIKDQGPVQILAATTNASFFSQTIGMTFGISNCPKGQAIFRADREVKEQEVFVTINFDALEQEMASGKGEKLSAFAEMLGCQDKGAFGKMTQKNYGKFFANDNATTPAGLLSAVRGEVTTEGTGSCKL